MRSAHLLPVLIILATNSLYTHAAGRRRGPAPRLDLNATNEVDTYQENETGSNRIPRNWADVAPTVQGTVRVLPHIITANFTPILRYAQSREGNENLTRSLFYNQLLSQDQKAQTMVLAYYRRLEGDTQGEALLLQNY